jgi:hypothetical protein
VINLESLIIKTPYKCQTQDRTNELFVQIEEGQVPLWKFGSVITWTVKIRSFPEPDHAEYARQQTQEAIAEWRIKGVEFQYVSEDKMNSATFIVKFSKTPSGSTVAKAFFPVEEQSSLVIYPIAFSAAQIGVMKNVLSHEIGHIYGLRHEFALKEGNTVQFGPSNPDSVMNYNSPPVIQETDRLWLQKLYDPLNPVTCIGDSDKFQVVRYAPFCGEQ